MNEWTNIPANIWMNKERKWIIRNWINDVLDKVKCHVSTKQYFMQNYCLMLVPLWRGEKKKKRWSWMGHILLGVKFMQRTFFTWMHLYLAFVGCDMVTLYLTEISKEIIWTSKYFRHRVFKLSWLSTQIFTSIANKTATQVWAACLCWSADVEKRKMEWF